MEKGLKVSGTTWKTTVVASGTDAVAPKYQHSKTGATWSGRGRAPA
ncbi:H-NS family nucleoid-associated regulatory protein [Paraburkholderia phenazinium]|nr:H-NS family nucleoid-associated regulatory protein [Paraburkholderia phenazinium]